MNGCDGTISCILFRAIEIGFFNLSLFECGTFFCSVIRTILFFAGWGYQIPEEQKFLSRQTRIKKRVRFSSDPISSCQPSCELEFVWFLLILSTPTLQLIRIRVLSCLICFNFLSLHYKKINILFWRFSLWLLTAENDNDDIFISIR